MTSVNRSLPDQMMNRIDHALGRPVDPMAGTIRNHYATASDSKISHEFRLSSFWLDNGERFGSSSFSVTSSGRHALKEYLRAMATNTDE